MSNSLLVNHINISPNSTNPRKDVIRKITIHHMAGNLSVEACGSIFAPVSRKASSNYGIGSDGRIGMYVEETNRAWTSSNAENDNQAVTIEVANDEIGGNWHVSDIAFAKLIDLCVDICLRNGIPALIYTSDIKGTLTRHNMFTDTSCPGPYLESKFPYIVDEVNKKLSTSGIPSTTSMQNLNKDFIATTVKHAATIIITNEGNYASVNKNDNGAVSIGKVQWHACRALALMQTIIKSNPIQAQNILGMSLYVEILGALSSSWDNRIINDDEATKISELLTTPEGIATQDALMEADITIYIQKGISYGLKDCGALIYFADGIHQYGVNSTLWKNIAETALKGVGNAAAMFDVTKRLTSNYLLRRERVYKAILALNITDNTFLPYLVHVTTTGLNIRKGPGINYRTNGVINDSGTYTIIEEADGTGAKKWGKLKSGVGWISLDFTKKI